MFPFPWLWGNGCKPYSPSMLLQKRYRMPFYKKGVVIIMMIGYHGIRFCVILIITNEKVLKLRPASGSPFAGGFF